MAPFLKTIALVAISAAAAAATYVCTATAGLKSSFPVTINTSARTASGSAGSARNSADGNQYIYCTLIGTTSITATCFAHDSTTNPAVSCSSTNANIVGAVKAVASDSLISLAWDTQNHCTQVQVVSGSYLEPKQP